MSRALLDALGADRGIVSIVGAGGKKTTLYALAGAHPGRIGVTCTVFMTKFSRRLGGHEIVSAVPDLSAEIARAADSHRVIAWARPSDKPGRVGGVDPEVVLRYHEAGGFEVTLVKADGARMRAIKAPDPDEPVLATGTGRIIPVVSAAAIGAPLDDTIAHRPERVAAVTGLVPGAAITPEAVGRLLASDQGALKDAGDAAVVPVINAVDDDERRGLAEQAARFALDASDPDAAWVIPEASSHMRTVVDGRLRVYRTRDAGETWTPLTRGLPQEHAWVGVLREGMDADPLTPVGLYFGTSSGHLFASRDGGASWRLIAGFLPRILSVTAGVAAR